MTRMQTAPTLPDPLRPRSAESPMRGGLFALLAHALLIGALVVGLSWRMREPEAVEAELWAAVPEAAAPAPAAVTARGEVPHVPPANVPPANVPPANVPPANVPPEVPQVPPEAPPEPSPHKPEDTPAPVPEADMATAALPPEPARPPKPERATTPRKPSAAPRPAAKPGPIGKAAQAARPAAPQAATPLRSTRDDMLARMNRELGGSGSAATGGGTAAQAKGPSAAYAARIRARIKPNVNAYSWSGGGNPETVLRVECNALGEVVNVRVARSSGSAAWDEIAVRAVERTGTLPLNEEGRIPPLMEIVIRPGDF